jgi:hypothetical protein
MAGIPLAAAPAANAEATADAPVVDHLRTNALVEPLGIGAEPPLLSWQVGADRRGVSQSAYQIRVGTSPGAADVWDSGPVASGRSVDVRYDGPALASAAAPKQSSRGIRSLIEVEYSRIRPHPVQLRLQVWSGSSCSTVANFSVLRTLCLMMWAAIFAVKASGNLMSGR